MKINFLRAADKVLGADASPLTYLVCLYFMIFSGGFIFFGDSNPVQSTVLAQLGILGGLHLWAFMLFGASGWVLTAISLKNKFFLSVSSIIGFLCWLIASMTYYQRDKGLHGTMALVASLMFVYFYMAGRLNRLWNYAPNRS